MVVNWQSNDVARRFQVMILSGVSLATLGTVPAFAQQAVESTGIGASSTTTSESTEEIVVTGSRISRPISNTADPISIFGQTEVTQRGLNTTQDLLKAIPQASRNRTATDAVGSPATVGHSQINLRGFGQASTLTLINGRRQVLVPVPNEDGSSFVDINTIPLIMVERMEIVQNGAAAIYGSDAVAGVANFILRRKFEGLELRGNYQLVPAGDQRDFTIGAVGGFSSGPLDVVIGGEYVDRNALAFADRKFSTGTAVSGTGSPGAFAAPGARPMIDPNCAAAGGLARPASAATPTFGSCAIDLTKYFELISPQWRVSTYVTANYDLGDADLYFEAGYSHSKVNQGSSPGSAVLTFPLVPANNPGNLVENGGFGVPVNFVGRPFGSRFPGTTNVHTLNAYRAVAGIRGGLGGSWKYDASYVYGHQDSEQSMANIDVDVGRFQAALNCQGGPNNDLCFNPFGSALLDPALANSQAVIDDFVRSTFRRGSGDIHVVEGAVTGQLAALPGGPLSVAFGAQFRRELLAYRSDPLSQTRQLGFYFTGPDFNTSRNTYAGFIEFDAPLSHNFDAQLAGRYEHTQGTSGTFTPKLGLRYEPTPGLVLRGSVGTSFRAPSLSQLTSVSTINTALIDPRNPSTIPFFVAVVTVPAANLKPEKSTNFNLGVWIEPVRGLSFSADYYYYDYKDVIAKQDAQSIINADPGDPRIKRANGDPNGLISSVDVSFVNQNSVKAQGFDFTASYRVDTGSDGNFNLTARGTYLLNYDTDLGFGRKNFAGFRNYQNFVDPLPRFKGNISATWQSGPHALSATLYYISSYKENLANPASPINGFKIDSYKTVDVQYSLEIPSINSTLAIGATNLFNEMPPAVGISTTDLAGFDTLVHDPRGRMLYVRTGVKF